MDKQQLRAQLEAAAGGLEAFVAGFNWRTFQPDRRADRELQDGVDALAAGLEQLERAGATSEDLEAWTARFIAKWTALQRAGAATANWMITGPARFPVERNRRRMETEHKRLEEYLEFAGSAAAWLTRRRRGAERAAASWRAAGGSYAERTIAGVRLVENTGLDRVQLIFPAKPSSEEREILKRRAFRWSPREGAWQRQLTANGIRAAEAVLEQLAA